MFTAAENCNVLDHVKIPDRRPCESSLEISH